MEIGPENFVGWGRGWNYGDKVGMGKIHGMETNFFHRVIFRRDAIA